MLLTFKFQAKVPGTGAGQNRPCYGADRSFVQQSQSFGRIYCCLACSLPQPTSWGKGALQEGLVEGEHSAIAIVFCYGAIPRSSVASEKRPRFVYTKASCKQRGEKLSQPRLALRPHCALRLSGLFRFAPVVVDSRHHVLEVVAGHDTIRAER